MKPLSAEWYRKRAEEVRYSGKTISQYNHFLGVAEAIEQAETVERYIASIQQEHDRWNAFREQAMDRQQFALVARYDDVCGALKMAINQARKILLPNDLKPTE